MAEHLKNPESLSENILVSCLRNSFCLSSVSDMMFWIFPVLLFSRVLHVTWAIW